MLIKDGRTIFTLIGLTSLIAMFIGYILIPWFEADSYFGELEYEVVIQGIEYREGYRGTPHILTNNTWRLLLFDELKIADHIAIGDSIVKRKGEIIEIFVKVDGRYQLKGRY